jgi:hypothetical protein
MFMVVQEARKASCLPEVQTIVRNYIINRQSESARLLHIDVLVIIFLPIQPILPALAIVVGLSILIPPPLGSPEDIPPSLL